MPSVREGESRESYVRRCIPYVIKKEGLKQEHAVAKCYGMYEQHKKKGKK